MQLWCHMKDGGSGDSQIGNSSLERRKGKEEMCLLILSHIRNFHNKYNNKTHQNLFARFLCVTIFSDDGFKNAWERNGLSVQRPLLALFSKTHRFYRAIIILALIIFLKNISQVHFVA